MCCSEFILILKTVIRIGMNNYKNIYTELIFCNSSVLGDKKNSL